MQRQLFYNMLVCSYIQSVSYNRPFEGCHEADVAYGKK